eukprot:scaffold8536_cov28-Attheya_sp.AAC.1
MGKAAAATAAAVQEYDPTQTLSRLSGCLELGGWGEGNIVDASFCPFFTDSFYRHFVCLLAC